MAARRFLAAKASFAAKKFARRHSRISRRSGHYRYEPWAAGSPAAHGLYWLRAWLLGRAAEALRLVSAVAQVLQRPPRALPCLPDRLALAEIMQGAHGALAGVACAQVVQGARGALACLAAP